jgi:hypothetical protein
MPEQAEKKTFEAKSTTHELTICTCAQDPISYLPAQECPGHGKKRGSLREARCPRCGEHYMTNRASDVCLACETGRD